MLLFGMKHQWYLKKALEIVYKTLQDVCFNNLKFGGKLVILGGDFRQIATVVKSG